MGKGDVVVELPYRCSLDQSCLVMEMTPLLGDYYFSAVQHERVTSAILSGTIVSAPLGWHSEISEPDPLTSTKQPTGCDGLMTVTTKSSGRSIGPSVLLDSPGSHGF